MSSTPNGPKREEGGTGGDVPRPSLDQTFLGVAPPAPARPAAASGSAIVAAPMISVSGKEPAPKPVAAPARPPEKATAEAAPAKPPTAAPARTNLGGGWQSAKVAPRPVGADRTLLHPSPPARAPVEARPTPNPAGRPFPRPEPPQASPGVTPVEPRPTGADAALQRTALASDYLRAARDAALAPRPEAAPQRVAPLPAAGRGPAPGDAAAVAPERPPAPIAAFNPPVQAARQQAAPPAFERAAALPRQPARDFSPAAGIDAADAAPRSMGTQASIAPPLEDAGRLPGPVVHSPRPPTELSMPARPPRSLAGTLLEQPLSAPVPTHQPPVERAVAAAAPSMAPVGGYATRFEPVPSVRAPLAEQSPGSFGLPAVGDHGPSDWSQQTAAPATGASAKTKKSGGSQTRQIALAALALGAIAFATFSDQFVSRGARVSEGSVRPSAPPTSLVEASTGSETAQTTMANRPAAAADKGDPPSTPVAPASSAPTGDTLAPTTPGDAERGSDEPSNATPGASAPDRTDVELNDSAASPEAKLAAAAGRHVIAGRYAEALPIYQQLQQTTPDNTAYAAMVRVLGRKVGAAQKSAATPDAPAIRGGKP